MAKAYYHYKKYEVMQGTKYSALKKRSVSPSPFSISENALVARSLKSVDGVGMVGENQILAKDLKLGEPFFVFITTTTATMAVLDNKEGALTGRHFPNSDYIEPIGKGAMRGNFVDDLTAEDGTYPDDGQYLNNWYVKGLIANYSPTVTLATGNNQKIYENGTVVISGSVADQDVGDAIVVKYRISSGSPKSLTAMISKGASLPFSKTLTFRNKRFYDGEDAVTGDLDDNVTHTLYVWAEDNRGGTSEVVTRSFQVSANRAPIVTINPIGNKVGQVDSDEITVSGTVSDPDGNTFTLAYRIGSGSFADVVMSGANFTFNFKLGVLKDGENTFTVRATDSYGAVSDKVFRINKQSRPRKLYESVKRYKITPPNKNAKGVILWVERDVGDLLVSAEVSMTANGEDESYQPMTFNSTAYVSTNREQDEFQFESDATKENIIVKITMVRENLESDKSIRLVSGVLS